jgi:hypothetical protein
MTTVRRAGPADLIALAWHQIGYRPRESMVLVGLHGPRHRSGLVVRCDLPPARAERGAADQLAGLVRRAGADAAIGLVFAERALARPPRALVTALRARLPRAGLSLLDVLGVDATAYRSYLCDDPACCPAEGRPLSEVTDSRASAELVLAGSTVGDDESCLVTDVLPTEAGSTEAGATEATGPPRRGDLSAAQRERWLAEWTERVARGEADAGWSAEFAGALTDVRLRDAVLLSLVPGADPLAWGLLNDEFTPEDALDRTGPVEQALARRPEAGDLEAGRAILAGVARHAPPGHRADPLAVLAWLGWWSGNGVRARLLVGRALADRPDHRLAALVGEMVRCFVPPPWADTASWVQQ